MIVSLKSFIASLCSLSLSQISVSLAKDEPDTNLVALMKEEGVKLLREAVGIYISTLKTGISFRNLSEASLPLPDLTGDLAGPPPADDGGRYFKVDLKAPR